MSRPLSATRRPGDAERFLSDFATMSTFGATPAGGVERQAATEADGQTRSWFVQWLVDRDFTVHIDRIGNIFGLYEFVPGAPFVLAGSHLDSQPLGGRFDGCYGVLAAAHAADRICLQHQESGVAPRFNIAVVDWFNEEGSRFKPSMMGSAVFTGKLALDAALNTTDVDGTTVGEALASIDSIGTQDVFGGDREVASYAEIHIEQGRLLDKQSLHIGLVTSTWGANKYEIAVLGAQSHTGSTAMVDRQDALYGAALAVTAIRELADSYDEELHTSCGQLNVYPNSPVVVAREVRMHFDLRSSDDAILDEANAFLQRRFAEIEVKANVSIEKRHAHTWKGTGYQAAGVELSRAAAADLELTHTDIRTLAGHDSTNMKDMVPSVMLFIPSVDGISHSELEFTRDEDLTNGVDLLTEVLARMIDGALVDGPAVYGAANSDPR